MLLRTVQMLRVTLITGLLLPIPLIVLLAVTALIALVLKAGIRTSTTITRAVRAGT